MCQFVVRGRGGECTNMGEAACGQLLGRDSVSGQDSQLSPEATYGSGWVVCLLCRRVSSTSSSFTGCNCVNVLAASRGSSDSLCVLMVSFSEKFSLSGCLLRVAFSSVFAVLFYFTFLKVVHVNASVSCSPLLLIYLRN